MEGGEEGLIPLSEIFRKKGIAFLGAGKGYWIIIIITIIPTPSQFTKIFLM